MVPSKVHRSFSRRWWVYMGYLTVAGTFHWLMDYYPVERIPYTPHSLKCSTGLGLTTQNRHFDYEIGFHNAVTNTWPNTTVRGCHFHYMQALWRHLQRLDLVPEYQVENSPIRAAFKMLTVLPFVPENLITTAWRQLRPTRLLREDLGWCSTR